MCRRSSYVVDEWLEERKCCEVIDCVLAVYILRITAVSAKEEHCYHAAQPHPSTLAQYHKSRWASFIQFISPFPSRLVFYMSSPFIHIRVCAPYPFSLIFLSTPPALRSKNLQSWSSSSLRTTRRSGGSRSNSTWHRKRHCSSRSLEIFHCDTV